MYPLYLTQYKSVSDSSRSIGTHNTLECALNKNQLTLSFDVLKQEQLFKLGSLLQGFPQASHQLLSTAFHSSPSSIKVEYIHTCSLISIEAGESAEARPREAAASQNTAACIEACRLDELFSDSKFLRAESLIEMVKAMMWSAGPVNRIAASGEESDTAEVKHLV